MNLQKSINNLLILTISVILFSCASTRTASFTDPDFSNKKFNKICVFVDVGDYEIKKTLESQIMSELKDYRVEVFIGSELLPPTRTWTDEQIKYNLKKNEITGYLKISITEQNVSNNMNNDRTLFTSFKTELIDVASDRVAYSATSNSNSSEGFSGEFLSIFESFSEDIVNDLKLSGHLP